MAKQFLDASGLNQYTQALKNGTLIVGKAGEASTANYASTANAEGLIGIIPLANLPEGALDRLVQVADKAARLALNSSQVQLGDTVQERDTKLMYIVVDESKLGTDDAEAAFVEYTAGRATFAQDAAHADVATNADNASNAVNAQEAVHATNADNALTANVANEVAWDNVTGTPTKFTPAAHTHGAADVSTLTGYTKSTATDDDRNLVETDNLLIALGKLEKKADDAAKVAGDHTHTSDKIVGMTGYSKGASYSPIETSDTLNVAIGKLEKLAVDSSVWDGIGGKPTVFTPADHDGAKVTSLATYVKAGNTGDIATTDNLVQALAKLENKAEAGADEPIPSSVIDSIVGGTFKP